MMMSDFKPMLAVNVEWDRLSFPLIAQPKHDGIRCVVVPGKGALNRSLKPIPNLYIRQILSDPKYHYHDGEIITYTNGKPDELSTIQSKVQSRDGEPEFVFHSFDHFENPHLPYKLRYEEIRAGERVESTVVHDLDELADYEKFLSDGGLTEKGLDGVILRCPDGKYKFGRSTAREGYLLRIKPFNDDEARIVGFVEQMSNTNEQTRDERGYAKRSKAKAGLVPTGKLGALILNWKGVHFELGTGFTDTQRKRFWRERESLLGRLVTFKYQRVGSQGRPLLPVFKSFRDEEELI